MRKCAYIISGTIAGILTFLLLVHIFSAEPESVAQNNDIESYDFIFEQIENETEIVEETITSNQAVERELIDHVEEVETEMVVEEENTTSIYTVKDGDTLWSISENFYNNGNYYRILAEYNNMNPNTSCISTGMELIIPEMNEDGNIVIKSEDNDVYTYGERTSPKVDIEISIDNAKNYTECVDTSDYEYVGSYKITGYDLYCSHCCGGNTNGIGAAGVQVIPGYSVATKDLPLGATLYIEGYGYYVNEDRGCGENVIDIVTSSHEDCYPITNLEGVNVYIVK